MHPPFLSLFCPHNVTRSVRRSLRRCADDGPDSKHLGVDPPVGKVWDHSTAKYVELPWDGSHHSVLVPTSVPNPKPADQPAQAHPVHLSPHSADAWASAPVGENLDNPQPAQHLRPMPTFQNEPPAHQQVSHASVHSHPHQAQPVQSQAAHPMQPVHHPQVSTAPVGAGQPHQTQRPQQAHQPLQQQQAQHHQQHMAHQSQRKKMTKPTGTPKPRGRPPKHHYWDGVLGKYVPEAQSTIALPVTYSSSVVKRKDEGVILGSEDKRRRVSLGRPRGRPPKDCRWDNDQGRYVQMVEAQPLPTAAHVEAAIQHAVAVQPPNMAPVLAQLPTQAVTQMMNPPQALS